MTEEDDKLLDQIQALLVEIPDAYEDFVRYTPSMAYGQGLAVDLLDYLRSSSDLTTSDVLDWIIDKAGWERKVSE